ncbi:MAG: AAA family ATPase [Bacillota bacterium]
MFDAFYSLSSMPFTRDIQTDKLFETTSYSALQDRLSYAVRSRLFCVVTGDVGTGKTTAIRKFTLSLDQNRYSIFYMSDSNLTPRNFYHDALQQAGCTPKFYRGDAKRQLQKEFASLVEVEHKSPVVIVDEAHLLSRPMLEEIRFLLNLKMDSYSPLSLILVGQSELKDCFKLKINEAISQRVGVRFHLPTMSKDETLGYIRSHLKASGCVSELFTEAAMSVIHEYCGGVARMVNNVCTSCLLAGASKNERLIDDHLVRDVITLEFEM